MCDFIVQIVYASGKRDKLITLSTSPQDTIQRNLDDLLFNSKCFRVK